MSQKRDRKVVVRGGQRHVWQAQPYLKRHGHKWGGNDRAREGPGSGHSWGDEYDKIRK